MPLVLERNLSTEPLLFANFIPTFLSKSLTHEYLNKAVYTSMGIYKQAYF